MADPVTLAVTIGLNAASMAINASQTIEGTRLDSTQVTNADYGAALLNFYGTRKLEGLSVMFAEDLKEVKRTRKTKGGKYNDYTYYGTFAVLVADHEIDQVLQIWFDEHLVYDTTGAGPVSPFSTGDGGTVTDFMRIYLGTADQDPDPRILSTVEGREGVGSCPAYRNVAFVMFEELPLEKLGNRLPQVKVMATSNGTPTYPSESFDTIISQPAHMSGATFSPDYSRFMWNDGDDYEIWDVTARSRMIKGTFPESVDGSQRTFGISNTGSIYAADDAYVLGGDIRVFEGDGATLSSTIDASALSFGAAFCTVKCRGDGFKEWLVAYPSILSTTFAYCQTDLAMLVTINTTDLVSGGFTVRGSCVDDDGDLWVVGAHQQTFVSTTKAYLLRVTLGGVQSLLLSEISGLTGAVVPDNIAVAFVTGGNFLIYDESDLLLVDTSGAILARDSIGFGYSMAKEIEALKFGASRLYFQASTSVDVYDLTDLSIIETINTSLWTDAADASGIIYDPVNHALITAPGMSQKLEWRYLDRATGGGQNLRSIVEDVATRSGLDVGNEVDASALDQTVLGYSWAQGTGKAILEPLLEFYNSEARPHDFKLQFIKRGASGIGQILVMDMGATIGNDKAVRYTIERTLDSDLTRRVSMTFADPDIDQQPNTIISQRHASSVDTSRELSLDLSTLAVSADDARSGSDAYLRRKWYAQEDYTTSVSRAYTSLEPGDVKSLDFDGISKNAKLLSLSFLANGVLDTKWERTDARVAIPPSQAGAPADGVIPPVIIAVGYTKGFVLDIPLVADADDGIITYLAAGPYSPGAWPGAVFFESDDGINYDTEYETVPSDHQATWGVTAGALPSALPELWDRVSTVSVALHDGTLSSATEEAVSNGANRALIGDEIVGFSTATLTAPLTYTLSGFLRGRRGTEQHTGTHAAGDSFILLNDDRVRHVHGASDVGDTFFIKPVTQGSGSGAGFPQTLDYSAASAKPYSAAHLEAEDVSGDIVFNWVRRTRIGGEALNFTTPPLGEGSEAYEVDILDAGGAVIRTLSGLTTPAATYTAGQQSSDGGLGDSALVYQLSTTVGRGFPAEIAI